MMLKVGRATAALLLIGNDISVLAASAAPAMNRNERDMTSPISLASVREGLHVALVERRDGV